MTKPELLHSLIETKVATENAVSACRNIVEILGVGHNANHPAVIRYEAWKARLERINDEVEDLTAILEN